MRQRGCYHTPSTHYDPERLNSDSIEDQISKYSILMHRSTIIVAINNTVLQQGYN